MNPLSSPLLIDLYQLTMLQVYLERGMQDTAVFEFFVRRLPPNRNFLMAAGLEQLLEFLEELGFSEEELAYLSSRFPRQVISYLENLRFEGDVHAMPEGTIFFPDEPVVRVTAPLPVAQLVESRIINLLHFQTLIASKAARAVIAAPDKLLVDFGLRRAHGAEAGLLAARASYLAGFSGTATVLAGALYGIPLYGTMAHSFIQAHDSEEAAFETFARSRSVNVVLLIDTYDTESAAEKVVKVARRLSAEGITIRGVRIDSGDLAEHARRVRKILDTGGFPEITIFASGNLDEYKVSELIAERAPISGFGVGTALDTSSDAPSLDCAYKLQEYAGKPRRKASEGKATLPGRKQAYRSYDAQGRMVRDCLALEDENVEGGEALLMPVMSNGKRLMGPPPLAELRENIRDRYRTVPEALRSLAAAHAFPVEISAGIRRLAVED
ncbi:MAG: nicotinate phosphoribosyltransferase [Burkholderiales bacterium]